MSHVMHAQCKMLAYIFFDDSNINHRTAKFNEKH